VKFCFKVTYKAWRCSYGKGDWSGLIEENKSFPSIVCCAFVLFGTSMGVKNYKIFASHKMKMSLTHSLYLKHKAKFIVNQT
jgi:hypothetical protein